MGLCISTTFCRQSTGRIDQGAIGGWTSEEFADRREVISVDTLPDDVLVAIFHHCVNDDDVQDLIETWKAWKAWQSLVQVCRRWRSIIFASPRHLKLRLVCTGETPARDMLDIWPALPLVINNLGVYSTRRMDNVIAVLERCDRVCQINFHYLSSPNMEIYLAAMQQPFPELTLLSLFSNFIDETLPVIPDSFLDGSAPRLQYLQLNGIPFPGLPKLLLSATHLYSLSLDGIPHSGYFSPEAMVTALSSSTSLSYFLLNFQSPKSCPDQANRRPPPSTRSVLPVLVSFTFQGVTEYLEDLVACIDAPRLNDVFIAFFNDTVFDTPHFIQFISRTPASRELETGHILLTDDDADLSFSSRKSDKRSFYVKILCQGLDWQLSSLEQVCTSCLPFLSMLDDLYATNYGGIPNSNGDIDSENGLWLQLLHPFTAVKNLYLTEPFALRIGPTLKELPEGRMMEVLPALQNIFLKGLESSGSVQEGIRLFVASRQVTSCPIVVSPWDGDRQR